MARVGIEAGLVGEEGMKKEKEPLLLSLSLSSAFLFGCCLDARFGGVGRGRQRGEEDRGGARAPK
jgi:hypothetical protein